MSQGTALLLAAGRGRRFGADKRLHEISEDWCLLSATLRCYLDAFGQVHCVTRPEDDTVRTTVAAQLSRRGYTNVRWIAAPQADGGMGFSLAAGANALSSRQDVLFVGLGDMPFVQLGTLSLLQQLTAREVVKHPRLILRPTHRARAGHPVAFAPQHLPALCELTSETGAKELLQAQAVRELAVADAGVLADVDRPEDLDR